MTREIIEDYRKIVIPFMKDQLLKINYEGLGESDAEEYEKHSNEILDMALQTLNQQEDTISRADALSEISSYFIADEDENGTTYQMAYEDGINTAYETVEKLPSVTPQLKTGHWIKPKGKVKPFGDDTVQCDM